MSPNEASTENLDVQKEESDLSKLKTPEPELRLFLRPSTPTTQTNPLRWNPQSQSPGTQRPSSHPLNPDY